jgi:uncharacterized OB-fold protein
VELSAKPIGEAHVVADGAGVLRLAGGECTECGALSFPQAEVCIACLSEEISTSPMADRGILYSYSIIRVGSENDKLPYAVGYVDLSNGIRVFSHLAGIETLSIDMPVSLHVEQAGEDENGASQYKFWVRTEDTTDA